MNLLITGAWSDAKAYFAALEARGHTICYLQQEADELPCAPDWAEGVICNGLFLHHPIEQFRNLRFIQLTSAGFDRVDMDYVKAHHIEIHNARGVYSVPMAEFAVSGVLQLYKQARFFYDNQKANQWEKHRGLRELSGKTVTILGCGSVGTECAVRFKAFGCRVLGVDLYPRQDAAYETICPLTALEELLPRTDVLILTVPLTDETLRLINRERLGLLPETAAVVNVSRGNVLDEAALCDLLRSGRLFGAVLDVFETEPLPENSQIWDTPNLIATPHNSFVGDGNRLRLNNLILKDLP